MRMIKFITMIVLTLLGTAMIFAGFVMVGFTANDGWNHIPLAVCMIFVGFGAGFVFSILAGVAYEDLPKKWR